VLHDAHWKARLDAQIKKGQSWQERLSIAVELYNEKFGSHVAPRVRTEGQAEHLYHAYRDHLFPRYAEWESRAHSIIHRRAAQEPAGVAP
jgi:hypothetical protein